MNDGNGVGNVGSLETIDLYLLEVILLTSYILLMEGYVRGDFSRDTHFLSGHFNWTEELKKCRSAKKSFELTLVKI